MTTSTRHPWRYATAAPAPRVSVPIPRSFAGLGRALRWSNPTVKLLWSVLFSSDDDPLLKGVATNYILLDDRLQYLNQDTILSFIQKQASPRVLVRILEKACQQRVLRRQAANKLENAILRASNKEGAWRDE